MEEGSDPDHRDRNRNRGAHPHPTPSLRSTDGNGAWDGNVDASDRATPASRRMRRCRFRPRFSSETRDVRSNRGKRASRCTATRASPRGTFPSCRFLSRVNLARHVVFRRREYGRVAIDVCVSSRIPRIRGESASRRRSSVPCLVVRREDESEGKRDGIPSTSRGRQGIPSFETTPAAISSATPWDPHRLVREVILEYPRAFLGGESRSLFEDEGSIRARTRATLRDGVSRTNEKRKEQDVLRTRDTTRALLRRS